MNQMIITCWNQLCLYVSYQYKQSYKSYHTLRDKICQRKQEQQISTAPNTSNALVYCSEDHVGSEYNTIQSSCDMAPKKHNNGIGGIVGSVVVLNQHQQQQQLQRLLKQQQQLAEECCLCQKGLLLAQMKERKQRQQQLHYIVTTKQQQQ